MAYVQDGHVIKEAVAVFHNLDELYLAIDELRDAGFSRADISLLADEEHVKARLGDAFWRAEDLEDEPDAPRQAYISEEAIGAAEGAAIGAPLYLGAFMGLGAVVNPALGIPAAIAAVVVGGGIGAAIGGILAERVGERHARYLATQLRHGGLILWVRTTDAAREAKALDILRRCSGGDVHLNDWVPDT